MFFDRNKLKKRAKWIFFPVVIALSLGLVFSSIQYAKAPAPVAQSQNDAPQDEAKMQAALREQTEKLEKQVTENPKNVEVLSQLAYIYTLTGETERGEAFFKQQTETLENEYQQNPTDIEVISALAACYETIGQNEQAVAKYQEIIEIEPDNYPIRLNLAVANFYDGKFAESEDQVKYVIEKQPDNNQAVHLYANILAGQDKFKEAVGQLEKFIDMTGEGKAVEQAKEDIAAWKKEMKK